MKRVFLSCALLAVLCCLLCACAGNRLTIEKPNAVILLEQPRRRYEAGEQVTIKTETLHDAGISASLNGQSVEKRGVRTENGYHLEFTFVMPEGDAVLRFEVTDGFLS